MRVFHVGIHCFTEKLIRLGKQVNGIGVGVVGYLITNLIVFSMQIHRHYCPIWEYWWLILACCSGHHSAGFCVVHIGMLCWPPFCWFLCGWHWHVVLAIILLVPAWLTLACYAGHHSAGSCMAHIGILFWPPFCWFLHGSHWHIVLATILLVPASLTLSCCSGHHSAGFCVVHIGMLCWPSFCWFLQGWHCHVVMATTPAGSCVADIDIFVLTTILLVPVWLTVAWCAGHHSVWLTLASFGCSPSALVRFQKEGTFKYIAAHRI